jgi:glycosyltransferase involved in cell wall biosynthesis
MKLAYLINQYPGISHTFIRREIEALERAGVDIRRFSIRSARHGVIAEEDRREAEKTTVLLDRPTATLVAALKSLLLRPFSSIRAIFDALRLGVRSESGLARHLFYAGEALALAARMRRDGLTHVHAHFGTNSATVAMLAAAVAGGTFSVTVHGPEEFDKPGLIALPEKIKRAAFTAAVSSFGMSQLRRLAPISNWDRIRIIPCGVERAFHAGAPAGFPEVPRFVCVGRLCEQKGQITLIEAAALARDRGAFFRLALVGDGDLRSEIEATVARLQLNNIVSMEGWRTPAQVRSEIETSTAFILPSYAEGLPVSIMEAMLLRRPVISTYVAGIPELVEHRKTGWLVPAGNVEALADAMVDAIKSPVAELEALGEAARARAIERHDIDKAAALLKTAFEDVVGGRTR